MQRGAVGTRGETGIGTGRDWSGQESGHGWGHGWGHRGCALASSSAACPHRRAPPRLGAHLEPRTGSERARDTAEAGHGPHPSCHEWVLGPSGLVPAAVGQPEAGAGAHRTGGTTAPCSRAARRGDADSRGFRLKNPHFPTPCSRRRLAACAHEGGSQVTGSFIPGDVQPVLKLAAPRQPPHRPAARFPSAQGQHM